MYRAGIGLFRLGGLRWAAVCGRSNVTRGLFRALASAIDGSMLINSKTITGVQHEPTLLRKAIDRIAFLASETGPSCRSQRRAGESPICLMLRGI